MKNIIGIRYNNKKMVYHSRINIVYHTLPAYNSLLQRISSNYTFYLRNVGTLLFYARIQRRYSAISTYQYHSVCTAPQITIFSNVTAFLSYSISQLTSSHVPNHYICIAWKQFRNATYYLAWKNLINVKYYD